MSDSFLWGLGGGLVTLAVLIFIATRLRNRMGINFNPVKCPRCGTPLPKVRMPTSLDETLWGGWTCPKCGCKVDKWGEDISKPGATSG